MYGMSWHAVTSAVFRRGEALGSSIISVLRRPEALGSSIIRILRRPEALGSSIIRILRRPETLGSSNCEDVLCRSARARKIFLGP